MSNVESQIAVEHITPSKVKINVKDRRIYIVNGAGYLTISKREIGIYLKGINREIVVELMIKGDKIKFVSRMYDYDKYTIQYIIPTSIVKLLRIEYGLNSTHFYVDVTLIVDYNKNKQKLILEVPPWSYEMNFDDSVEVEAIEDIVKEIEGGEQ